MNKQTKPKPSKGFLTRIRLSRHCCPGSQGSAWGYFPFQSKDTFQLGQMTDKSLRPRLPGCPTPLQPAHMSSSWYMHLGTWCPQDTSSRKTLGAQKPWKWSIHPCSSNECLQDNHGSDECQGQGELGGRWGGSDLRQEAWSVTVVPLMTLTQLFME